MHVLIFFLKWGSTGYSLGIVQWNFTRRDHPGNPGWGIRVGSCHARPSVAAASPTPAAVQSPAGDVEGSSSMAPAQRRYHTWVGPTPPASSHPRPARTSGPRESSTSRSRAPPSPPYRGISGAPDLSPASIIRRPYFPCDPIPRNIGCKGSDFHGEVYSISRHFPQTRGSETPCSSCSDTIYSHSWCRVSSIILG